MALYPHWNARDNYRYGQKKKKRKRDKSDDPGKNANDDINNGVFFQWHSLTRAEQAKYYEAARVERQQHTAMYPQWSARQYTARYALKELLGTILAIFRTILAIFEDHFGNFWGLFWQFLGKLFRGKPSIIF